MATTRTKRTQGSRLSDLGAYGFSKHETVILAALVTEDPLLLIGNSGTGKTYLLNSISEALGLEHRHYNASLISFDDLVGFPFPDDEKASVKFLETPATVWGAQSVLVDEISRCKPEHQNRLFSLVHERRLQGIPLHRLTYRWAAMNPCSADQGGDYIGSEPLDRALADRFGLLVQVGDWRDLGKKNQLKVADPSGEGRIADDGGKLAAALVQWKLRYEELLPQCPEPIVAYASAATTALNEGGVRVSPRRARMLARSLLAATVVGGSGMDSALFREVLECSLPHPAWGEIVRPEAVGAAHRIAWDTAMSSGEQRWIHDFHLEPSLSKRVQLLAEAPSPDVGTSAVSQMLANDTSLRRAVFAMALYPAAASGRFPTIGAEGIADLGRVAQPILDVDSEITWQERIADKDTVHPELVRSSKTLGTLKGARRERAEQLFSFCVAQKLSANFDDIELELEECVREVAKAVKIWQTSK